ncbi:glycosyltransferase family 2 protein [uncultured Paraglaciecola sp.]|uniref:glycosyltransferase family 2 protein n=1 Tax=uncultured Paraglaciecola sp. TaxID=1765024 RepID=UPI0025924924|nr:glycosyltransferase family 2 protein [uncultured Paraglaciecola sp.]
MLNTKKAVKVKLIAIAKDECAYLANWIFHHLYCGFAEIEVILNRTGDESFKLMKNICRFNEKVTFSFSDFVDLVPGSAHTKMQHIAYALSYQKAVSKPSNDITHLMFLDIDEFWISTNLDLKINEFIEKTSDEKGISFCWMNDIPNKERFVGLGCEIRGEKSNLVKSVIPISSGLRAMRIHQPLLKKHQYILADGSPFEEDLVIKEHSQRCVYTPAFIYHHCFRSSLEYVSSLYKGRPGYKNIPLKLNRSGLPMLGEQSLSVTFSAESFGKYQEAKNEFFQYGRILEITQSGQHFVVERYFDTIASLKKMLPANHKKLLRVFANVDIKEVDCVFSTFHDELIQGFNGRVEFIRDLAIKVESYNISEAKRIMLKAQSLRPKGTIINAKIEEYSNALEK